MLGTGGAPRSWALQDALSTPPVMGLPLADLARFEDTHNDRLGFHARNIKAVAPEVRYVLNYLLSVAFAECRTPAELSKVSFQGEGLQHGNVTI